MECFTQDTRETKRQLRPQLRCWTLLLRRQAAMQDLEWPEDIAVKQMISLTCLLGQINIKNLCRQKSKLLIEVWTTLQGFSGTDGQISWEWWEWWGGTTQTIFTQTIDKWDLPFIPSVLHTCPVSSLPGRSLMLSLTFLLFNTFPRVY